MSNAPSQQSGGPSTSDPPARNPLERIVVWGLIIVLLGLVGAEAMARFSYENSLESLEAAIAKDEDGDPLMVEEVAGHISGFPTRNDDTEKQVLTYSWSGLLKTYGTITMPYSQKSVVFGLVTADAPPESEIDFIEEETDDPLDAEEPEGESGGQERRAGGRGQRFDPMQFDSDGDGKVSRDEAPEPMQERFDDIDTNGDGFADEAEFAARRAAFQRGGRGGRGGEERERPQRPQRPALDDASDEDKGDESPADTPDPESTPEKEE